MFSKIHIPADREENILRRDGYTYLLAVIVLQKGKKLGLGIRHVQNRVLVSKIEADSLAAECLHLGDRVCEVGGTVVSDKGGFHI
uniref:PDZ domain-containing protein n=1 Tax=Rhabditophanes sp. KR3021 TaxID=114890 RepID=A0AC35TYE1_9BILA